MGHPSLVLSVEQLDQQVAVEARQLQAGPCLLALCLLTENVLAQAGLGDVTLAALEDRSQGRRSHSESVQHDVLAEVLVFAALDWEELCELVNLGQEGCSLAFLVDVSCLLVLDQPEELLQLGLPPLVGLLPDIAQELDDVNVPLLHRTESPRVLLMLPVWQRQKALRLSA